MRSAAAASIWSMLDTCESCVIGWVKLRTYCMNAWTSPMVMEPPIARKAPTTTTAT